MGSNPITCIKMYIKSYIKKAIISKFKINSHYLYYIKKFKKLFGLQRTIIFPKNFLIKKSLKKKDEPILKKKYLVFKKNFILPDFHTVDVPVKNKIYKKKKLLKKINFNRNFKNLMKHSLRTGYKYKIENLSRTILFYIKKLPKIKRIKKNFKFRYLEQAFLQTKPGLSFRLKRKGSRIIKKPFLIKKRRSSFLSSKWLITFAKNRTNKDFYKNLAEEILDSCYNKSLSCKKFLTTQEEAYDAFKESRRKSKKRKPKIIKPFDPIKALEVKNLFIRDHYKKRHLLILKKRLTRRINKTPKTMFLLKKLKKKLFGKKDSIIKRKLNIFYKKKAIKKKSKNVKYKKKVIVKKKYFKKKIIKKKNTN